MSWSKFKYPGFVISFSYNPPYIKGSSRYKWPDFKRLSFPQEVGVYPKSDIIHCNFTIESFGIMLKS
jgi:hypothetical protein